MFLTFFTTPSGDRKKLQVFITHIEPNQTNGPYMLYQDAKPNLSLESYFCDTLKNGNNFCILLINEEDNGKTTKNIYKISYVYPRLVYYYSF